MCFGIALSEATMLSAVCCRVAVLSGMAGTDGVGEEPCRSPAPCRSGRR